MTELRVLTRISLLLTCCALNLKHEQCHANNLNPAQKHYFNHSGRFQGLRPAMTCSRQESGPEQQMAAKSYSMCIKGWTCITCTARFLYSTKASSTHWYDPENTYEPNNVHCGGRWHHQPRSKHLHSVQCDLTKHDEEQ